MWSLPEGSLVHQDASTESGQIQERWLLEHSASVPVNKESAAEVTSRITDKEQVWLISNAAEVRQGGEGDRQSRPAAMTRWLDRKLKEI